MLILVLLNIVLFAVFHTLSIEDATYHYYGLLAVILLNSLYASRKFKYGKAVLFPITAVILFILLKYVINYLGNYRVMIDPQAEVPFGVQIFSSVIELIGFIILSSILVLISRLIFKPKRSNAENDDLISRIGGDE